VGFTRSRIGRDGRVRYQALYNDVKGHRRSAGTFATEKRANAAWQRAEARLTEGRLGDPRRGKQQFGRYVQEEWLPHHLIEARTRENYTYYLDKHILPTFGTMRMIAILPIDVREWVTDLVRRGVPPSAIRYCMTILSAIFTTALNDQVVHLHPCRGVKTPPVPKKLRAIVTPERFDRLYAGLTSNVMRLLVETDIETGLRWGELTELRPKDIDFSTRILTVSRVVVELVPKFHPTGKRFLVKEYPKDKEHRRLKLSVQIANKLQAYVTEQELDDEDLLFPMPESPKESTPHALANPDTLGLTEPNTAGRRYRHGTPSAYTAGKCRCQHCRGTQAHYRAERRAAGKDQPRGRRVVDTDGHIPRRWFREHIWLPALEAAGSKDAHVKVNGLRHAHASWLLAGGADLQVVKERLGHASISTTEKYLHILPDADETALGALARIRNRQGR
jgi:site-specific recombinase XerD